MFQGSLRLITTLKVQIQVSTDTEPINFGQSFTLPSSWVGPIVQNSSSAPSNGFQFVNEASQAACILYKQFNGQQNPFYVSAAGLLPPGDENIVPTSQVKLWFQTGNQEPGTPVADGFQSSSITINFQGVMNQTAQYTSQGTWTLGQ